MPGPRVPLYLLGRRLMELYPYVPMLNGMRITVGIFSYLDSSLRRQRRLRRRAGRRLLADGIRAGFDELVAEATAAPAAAG